MDPAAKQQIVERIRQANNILVTVSSSPTVDQLAACIGLTLLLTKMDKHATAVFSGKIPSTIEFLQPEKTIEVNTDSLQDFIISLDKNKADKLRYKVEGDVVKIFITPYKTSINEHDLVFSQGDFNVDVVMALGITDQSHIDAAITSHGRILHDATVISVNAGQAKAELGQINWQDPAASSLCEMIVSISEAFGGGLIDNQMATAFLTGIVAETGRFSNTKTSPKVMTMSAQLMAAGANQQLIVSKLETAPAATRNMPIARQKAPSAGAPEATPADGSLTIDHKNDDKTVAPLLDPNEIHIDEEGNIKTAADLNLPQPEAEAEPAEEAPASGPVPAVTPEPALKPPEEPNPHALLDAQEPAMTKAFTANTEPEWEDPYNKVSIDPLTSKPETPELFEHGKPKLSPAGDSTAPASVDTARNAVENALAAAPFDPAMNPVEALNAAPLDTTSTEETTQSESSQNENAPKEAEQPAPPPFPPPLEPNPGAMIPGAPHSQSQV